jgi:hypothetical protein
MEIKLSIGTHQISLYPIGQTESLQICYTWHKSQTLHDWSLQRLLAVCDAAECDTDYIKAERLFGWMATGENPTPITY